MTLRDVFEAYGITQHDLVEQLCLQRQYAYLLFRGDRRLGHRLGLRIADTFGLPIEVLLAPERYTPERLPPRHPPQPPDADGVMQG